MGPNPNGPRSVTCDRAIRYPGSGVLAVGPVVDFLDDSDSSRAINTGPDFVEKLP